MTELKGAQRIIDLLNEKKRKWNVTMDANSPLWKVKYGTIIAKPYQLVDVDNMCQNKKILLPEDLVYYLSCISKEFFINKYPVEFDLTNLPNKSDVENIEISESLIYLTESKIDYEKLAKVMLKVGDDGENYTCIYVGFGPQFGSIWYYNSADKIWIKKNDNIILEVCKELGTI